MSKRLTIADIKRAAAKHGGRVESDGCGGYEVISPEGTRWIDAEVQYYVLPVRESNPEDVQDMLRQCMDFIKSGHEPYGYNP
jgi:hypothetical protein